MIFHGIIQRYVTCASNQCNYATDVVLINMVSHSSHSISGNWVTFVSWAERVQKWKLQTGLPH